MYVKFIWNVAPWLGRHAKNYSFVNMKPGCFQLELCPPCHLSFCFLFWMTYKLSLPHFIWCTSHYYTTQTVCCRPHLASTGCCLWRKCHDTWCTLLYNPIPVDHCDFLELTLMDIMILNMDHSNFLITLKCKKVAGATVMFSRNWNEGGYIICYFCPSNHYSIYWEDLGDELGP